MSKHSSITGTISLSLFALDTQPQADFLLKTALSSLPDINPTYQYPYSPYSLYSLSHPVPYESEHIFDIFINQPHFSNISCTHDENSISTRYSSYNLENKNRFVSNTSYYYSHSPLQRLVEFNSEYILTVHGQFRDAYFDNTFKSFIDWLTRLAKKIEVTDVCVSIKGEKIVINTQELNGQETKEVEYIVTNKNNCFTKLYDCDKDDEVGEYKRIFNKRWRQKYDELRKS